MQKSITIDMLFICIVLARKHKSGPSDASLSK